MAADLGAAFTRPPEWKDEERMYFLFSPFPPNTVAQASDPKVAFWSSLIMSSSRELRRPTFTEQALKERFLWKQSTPSCLCSVLQGMERSGLLVRRNDFNKPIAGASWFSWGVGMVTKPVSWAVKSYLPTRKYDGEFVILPLVEEYAELVVVEHSKRMQYKSTDRIMRCCDFLALCEGVVSKESTEVVMQHLLRERIIVTGTTPQDLQVVKFSSSEDGKTVSLTEADFGILSIKEALRTLSQQVQALQEQTQKLKDAARERLKQKNRSGALQCLRRSKLAEATLGKREAALDNLQAVLNQIQMAETDAMVLKAYRQGAETMRSLRESQGLTLENAESAVAELKDAFEEGDEISKVLSEVIPGEVCGEQEDGELEEELAALLAEGGGDTCSLDSDDLERHFAALAIKGEGEGEKAAPQVSSSGSGGETRLADSDSTRTEPQPQQSTAAAHKRVAVPA